MEGTITIPTDNKGVCPVKTGADQKCLPIPTVDMRDDAFDKDDYPKRPVEGELIIKNGIGNNDFLFCVPIRESPGWRAYERKYDEIATPAFGYRPLEHLGTDEATVISAATSATATIIATSKATNNTWKTGLGVAGLGYPVFYFVKGYIRRGYLPFREHAEPDTYYLAINSEGRYPINSNGGHDSQVFAPPPGGTLAVFALKEEGFWPAALTLQSLSGLPLGQLPRSGGQSGDLSK